MNDFGKLSRPRIIADEDLILISDPPIGTRIFLTLLCLVFALVSFLEGLDEHFWVIILCLFGSIAFLYDALSLNRVRVDLRNKFIFRKSLNPVANLIDRILQHPNIIPFDKISSIGVDYTETFGGPAITRYYLYVEYDGLYKLTIGIFKRSDEAARFAEFLRRRIKDRHAVSDR